jgi:hypothetical protein
LATLFSRMNEVVKVDFLAEDRENIGLEGWGF